MKTADLLDPARGLFRLLPQALLAALALGACAHKQPLSAPVELLAPAAETVYYVAPEQFRTAQFALPPAPDSAGQQADLAGVLAWQNKRTEADCAKSARTAKEEYDDYWGGKSIFPGPVPQEFKDFFARLSADFEGALDEIKVRFKRPRPYSAYPEDARPCIKKSKSFSYPSGHSSAARVTAAVLADLAPERRAEFYAKSDEVALDRLIGGVHFPSDIAAGKVFGDLFHAELLKSPAYRGDLEKLKPLVSR